MNKIKASTTEKSTFDEKRNEFKQIKTNILLTIILVPLGLLCLVIIVLLLWFWKCKIDKLNKKKQNFKSPSNVASNKSVGNCRFCFTKSNNKLNMCCFGFKAAGVTNENKNDIKPAIRKNNIQHILDSTMSTQSNRYYKDTSFPYLDSETHATSYKTVTNSHATLSSHFEDNNWDYNFAMRGLYLSQPWVKGRYNPQFGSDSFQESNTNFNKTSFDKKNKITEHGGSDTDGVYA